MKRKKKDLTEKEIIKTLDALYTAVGSIRSRQAAKLILRDLLTESERLMMGRRILIARLLLGGETYEGIGERLGVGRSTVSRVDKWLNDQIPGYETAIKGIEKEERRRTTRNERDYGPYSFRALKRKYPLRRLLFSALEPPRRNRKK
jgi:uncharacterized protein YerC